MPDLTEVLRRGEENGFTDTREADLGLGDFKYVAPPQEGARRLFIPDHDPHAVLQLGRPPLLDCMRRPFAQHQLINDIQTLKAFLRKQEDVRELVKRICDFYLMLCQPFSSYTTHSVPLVAPEEGAEMMHNDLERMRTAWQLLSRNSLAALNGELPPLLHAVLEEAHLLLENATYVFGEAKWHNPSTSFLGGLFARKSGKRIELRGQDQPRAVLQLFNQMLTDALKKPPIESGPLGLSMFDFARVPSIALLELLHTSLSFEGKLQNVLTDPRFSLDGSLTLRGLHQASFVARHPDASIPQDEIHLTASEPVLVIAGPNNAGKSHLLRAIGQVFAMAYAGLQVAASHAEIPPLTNILTHHPRDYQGSDVGKFEAEIRDLAQLSAAVTPGTLVLLDEMLAGAAPRESVTEVGVRVVKAFSGRGARVCMVTHNLDLMMILAEHAQARVYTPAEGTPHQFCPTKASEMDSLTAAYDRTVHNIAAKHGFGS